MRTTHCRYSNFFVVQRLKASPDDSRSVVAAMLAYADSRLDRDIPADVDLRHIVGDDLLATVDEVIAEQAKRSPT